MDEATRPLGQELRLRRLQRGLSQRKLGNLATEMAERLGLKPVYYTVVHSIESAKKRLGRESRPEVESLRAIAYALATDLADRTRVDEDAAADHFRALMRAARYTSVDVAAGPAADLEDLVHAFVGDERARLALASGITDWSRFNLHDQAFLIRAVQLARQHANLPDLPGLPPVPEP